MCSAFHTETNKNEKNGTSLAVQWLRFHLPILRLFYVFVFFFLAMRHVGSQLPNQGSLLNFSLKLHCLHPSHDLAPCTWQPKLSFQRKICSAFFPFFLTGVQLVYAVMSVSTVQQSESATRIHASLPLCICFLFRSPQSTKYSSLCYKVGSHQLPVLYIVSLMDVCQPPSPSSSHSTIHFFCNKELTLQRQASCLVYCCVPDTLQRASNRNLSTNTYIIKFSSHLSICWRLFFYTQFRLSRLSLILKSSILPGFPFSFSPL